jgi:hypothetical protein
MIRPIRVLYLELLFKAGAYKVEGELFRNLAADEHRYAQISCNSTAPRPPILGVTDACSPKIGGRGAEQLRQFEQ